VCKYVDAIVKIVSNWSVMTILIAISHVYIELRTIRHSWLRIVIVLTTTYRYCYMNVGLRLPE